MIPGHIFETFSKTTSTEKYGLLCIGTFYSTTFVHLFPQTQNKDILNFKHWVRLVPQYAAKHDLRGQRSCYLGVMTVN